MVKYQIQVYVATIATYMYIWFYCSHVDVPATQCTDMCINGECIFINQEDKYSCMYVEFNMSNDNMNILRKSQCFANENRAPNRSVEIICVKADGI